MRGRVAATVAAVVVVVGLVGAAPAGAATTRYEGEDVWPGAAPDGSEDVYRCQPAAGGNLMWFTGGEGPQSGGGYVYTDGEPYQMTCSFSIPAGEYTGELVGRFGEETRAGGSTTTVTASVDGSAGQTVTTAGSSEETPWWSPPVVIHVGELGPGNHSVTLSAPTNLSLDYLELTSAAPATTTTTTGAPATTLPPESTTTTTAPPPETTTTTAASESTTTTSPPTTVPPQPVAAVVLDGDQAQVLYHVGGLVALAVGLYVGGLIYRGVR